MPAERDIAAAPVRPAGPGLSIPAPIGGLLALLFALLVMTLAAYALPAIFLAAALLVEWLS